MGHESRVGGRLVFEHNECLAVTSFAPRFPYETWLVPRRHGHDFGDVSDAQIGGVAAGLKRVLLGLESILGTFPFNLILHTASVRVTEPVCRAFHWRFEIVPRLTIPSGFELGSDVFIVGVSPEAAAGALRAATT